MAFNMYGTMTTGQWESFKAFTKIQQKDIVLRRQWLEKQLFLNGIFTTNYEGDVPVLFSANDGSYAAKLLSAYRILGGVPERDMLLRTSDKPVFKTKAQPVSDGPNSTVDGGFSDVYSNGRRDRGTQRFDRDLGIRVDRLKNWQLESIKSKRERLEFKIKRAMDYSDQMQKEIELLSSLLGDETSQGSVDNLIVSVETQMATPGAMNVVQDLDDVFGLKIGKPGDLTFSDSLTEAKERNERVPA